MQPKRYGLVITTILMIIVVLMNGCARPVQSAVHQSDKPRLVSDASDAELAELVGGNSGFSFDLYQALREQQDGNLFYSPYSISIALAMTYAGARGDTEHQMAETLHYTLPQERLHPAYNALDAALTPDKELEDTFQLNIANRIWGQQGFEFLPAFLDTLAENYGAGLHTLDFVKDAEGARQAINKWVSDQTEEKIQDLIPSGVLDTFTRLVLTNAIYFNGKWMLPFDPNNTQDDTFTLLDDTRVQVPMMSQFETINYTKGEGYQAIELPYRGSDMSMVFVLPEKERYEEIEAAFSTDLLDTIIAGFSPHEVDLSIPKYKFESEFNLSNTLIDMGMPDAFYDADFSGMTGKPRLFISDVLHKTFVAVDEEGTEAAAATAVIMKESAIMPETLIEVKFDHPFLFLIRDNSTGTILFIGRVLNPAES